MKPEKSGCVRERSRFGRYKEVIMMSKIRFYFAMAAAKLTYRLLRICGRAATHTPGAVAVRLCPDFLGHLKKPETLICVTGTDGKTTVSNLLASILQDNGYTVTNNSYGSNICEGVISALLTDATFSGKPKKQVGVLEVDERSSLKVYKYLTPDILICNNIMRDSLKRNAHTDFICYILNKQLPESVKVVLNADDLICSGLFPNNTDRTYFGVSAEKPENGVSTDGALRDIVYCPECGARLETEYVRYNHIGRHRCPACGFASPRPDYDVTAIDRETGTVTVTHNGENEEYKIINDNIINIYNSCAVISVLHTFGMDYGQIRRSFETAKIVSSRFDIKKVGEYTIVGQLAKGQNPVACAMAYRYAASFQTSSPDAKKGVLVLVDDVGDNTGNSESTCWLYDCDYSALCDPSIGQIVFSGPRCLDHRLRALMAGVDASKIVTCPTFDGGVGLLDTEKYKDLFVLFDPYLIEEGNAAKRFLEEKGGAAQ